MKNILPCIDNENVSNTVRILLRNMDFSYNKLRSQKKSNLKMHYTVKDYLQQLLVIAGNLCKFILAALYVICRKYTYTQCTKK